MEINLLSFILMTVFNALICVLLPKLVSLKEVSKQRS